MSTIIFHILGPAGSAADAEETASDVFLALWHRADRVRPGKLKAYLSGVARNKAREKVRSRGRELPLEEDLPVLSPEYAATREWEDQLSAWFQKGENLVEAGEDPEVDAYFMAGAHSPEAREALDALLERYGLALHSGFGEYRSLDALYAAAGGSDFLPAPGTDGTGPAFARLYDDGTLTCTASAALPDGGAVDYDLFSLKKGTFTRTGYLLADAADLESWTMTAADGTELLLALSGEKAILAADGAECFVFVNFRGGTGSTPALDRDTLEALAAEFDLAALRALAQG